MSPYFQYFSNWYLNSLKSSAQYLLNSSHRAQAKSRTLQTWHTILPTTFQMKHRSTLYLHSFWTNKVHTTPKKFSYFGQLLGKGGVYWHHWNRRKTRLHTAFLLRQIHIKDMIRVELIMQNTFFWTVWAHTTWWMDWNSSTLPKIAVTFAPI